MENLKNFPGEHDCYCALQRGDMGGKKNSGKDADHTPWQGYSRRGGSALFVQGFVQVRTNTVGSFLQGCSGQVGVALGDLAVGMPQDLLDFVERPAGVDEHGGKIMADLTLQCAGDSMNAQGSAHQAV